MPYKPNCRRLQRQLLALLLLLPLGLTAAPSPQHIIIDTDLGADIDDAFALLLAIHSPTLSLDLVTVSYGPTQSKAKLVQRLLADAGRADIPIAIGPATPNRDGYPLKTWADHSPLPPHSYPAAVPALLARLRKAPAHSITLVALAPLTTIDAAMNRDMDSFRRLAGVIIMAGSIHRGYGKLAGSNSPTPMLETNARLDPVGLRHLLASGVPVTLMPLDATEIAIDAPLRKQLFTAAGPLAPDLHQLYQAWAAASRYGATPVAFDAVPVARLLDPATCPLTPLHLSISPRGDTRITPGRANTRVCLSVDKDRVHAMLQQRID